MASYPQHPHEISPTDCAQPDAVYRPTKLFARESVEGVTTEQEAWAHRTLDRVALGVQPMPSIYQITRALWITGDAVGLKEEDGQD